MSSITEPPKPKKCKDGSDPAADGSCADGSIAMGGRRRTLKAKTLRRMLKKKGLKTTGKKSTLMKRLHLKGGGIGDTAAPWDGGFDTHGAGNPSYSAIRGS